MRIIDDDNEGFMVNNNQVRQQQIPISSPISYNYTNNNNNINLINTNINN